MAINGRVQLFQTIMSPEDIAMSFGPQLGADALRLQSDSAAARAAVLATSSDSAPAPTVHPQDVIQSAPEVVSLNGQPSQVNGCDWNLPPQPKLGPAPIPTMPLRAPVVVDTPIGPATFPPPVSPSAPIWTNLCWALRNAAVDASQFDPSELQQLQYRCSQLGYTGACFAPPNTFAWLQANRGHLPHIQVTSDLLESIPQSPDLTGVPCSQSYRMSGLTGYAPSWSDALVMDQKEPSSVPDVGVGDWIGQHPWLSLAIAAAGVAVISHQQKKGRR